MDNNYTVEKLIDEMWVLLNTVSDEEFDKIFNEKRNRIRQIDLP